MGQHCPGGVVTISSSAHSGKAQSTVEQSRDSAFVAAIAHIAIKINVVASPP